jgi:hypothetical protein
MLKLKIHKHIHFKGHQGRSVMVEASEGLFLEHSRQKLQKIKQRKEQNANINLKHSPITAKMSDTEKEQKLCKICLTPLWHSGWNQRTAWMISQLHHGRPALF